MALVGLATAGCSGSAADSSASEATETRATTTDTTAGEAVETVPTGTGGSEGATLGRPLKELLLAPREVAPGARIVFEREGEEQPLHGHLGREPKRFDFGLRAFDVRNSEFRDSPGAAIVVSEVERWAQRGDVSVRIFDWVFEDPRRPDLERERELAFLVRMRQLGIPAATARIERHSLPPGLGQASMAAVVHFTATGGRGDDVVVLFGCGNFVGRVDIVGRRGSVALDDALDLARLMAEKMGEVCA